MKQFLIEEYEENVLFFQPNCKNKSPIVLVINISLTQVIEGIRQLVDDINNKIKDVTEILKSKLLETDLQNIDSYVCDDVVVDKYLNTFELPPTWAHFCYRFNAINEY